MHRKRRMLPRDHALCESRNELKASGSGDVEESVFNSRCCRDRLRETTSTTKRERSGRPLAVQWYPSYGSSKDAETGRVGERERDMGQGVTGFGLCHKSSRRYCTVMRPNFPAKQLFDRQGESLPQFPLAAETETQQAPLWSTGRQSHDLVPAPGAWHSI